MLSMSLRKFMHFLIKSLTVMNSQERYNEDGQPWTSSEWNLRLEGKNTEHIMTGLQLWCSQDRQRTPQETKDQRVKDSCFEVCCDMAQWLKRFPHKCEDGVWISRIHIQCQHSNLHLKSQHLVGGDGGIPKAYWALSLVSWWAWGSVRDPTSKKERKKKGG